MLVKNRAGLKGQEYPPWKSSSRFRQIQACPLHWDRNPWGWLARSQVDTDSLSLLWSHMVGICKLISNSLYNSLSSKKSQNDANLSRTSL